MSDGTDDDDNDDDDDRNISKNIFKPCNHIDSNTTNPNPILQITISFTKTQKQNIFVFCFILVFFLENVGKTKKNTTTEFQTSIFYYV